MAKVKVFDFDFLLPLVRYVLSASTCFAKL
jgi:hypothetical protein